MCIRDRTIILWSKSWLASATSIVYEIKGLPSINRMFLLGTPLDPPRAVITASIFREIFISTQFFYRYLEGFWLANQLCVHLHGRHHTGHWMGIVHLSSVVVLLILSL